MAISVLEHFSARVMPEPNSGCWFWMGSLTQKGYGDVLLIENGKRQHVRAHRIAWALYKGTVPPGKMVCHKCDIRCCVNPDHLFLGTASDNVRDMVAKGRSSQQIRNFGTKSPHAKITAAAALAIFQSTESEIALAARYGICHSTVRRIRQKKKWKHIHP